MESNRKIAVTFGTMGLLCAACCALPVLAGIGIATGALTSIFAANKFLIIGGVLLVGAAAFVYLRTRAKVCTGGSECTLVCGCKK